jgi:hypothetical protein
MSQGLEVKPPSRKNNDRENQMQIKPKTHPTNRGLEPPPNWTRLIELSCLLS